MTHVRPDRGGLAALRAAVLAMHGAQPQLALAGAGEAGTPIPAERFSDWTVLSVASQQAVGGVLGGVLPDTTDPETFRMVGLVERAQSGDGEAFAQLYDKYVDTVYRYIYYRVGQAPLAEDLTSETFLRALRRISSFTWQGRDFGAWLVTIARNLVSDHFKSSRFRLEVTTAEMLDGGVEESPEGAVLAYLTNTALMEAVKRLNAQQQECIVLRFLQGLSVAETAKIMGKNEGAIKTLQYRAVRTLAQLLPQDVR